MENVEKYFIARPPTMKKGFRTYKETRNCLRNILYKFTDKIILEFEEILSAELEEDFGNNSFFWGGTGYILRILPNFLLDRLFSQKCILGFLDKYIKIRRSSPLSREQKIWQYFCRVLIFRAFLIYIVNLSTKFLLKQKNESFP